MPNTRSLNLTPLIISATVLIANNSDPKNNVSIVFCRLQYHTIDALLRNINTPV